MPNDNLTELQQVLYDKLKDAIENNGDIYNALQGQNLEEIAAVIVADNSGNKLFTDAIEKNMEAVEQICSKIYQPYVPTGDITGILENKALSSILQDNGKIAQKILKFKSRNPKVFVVNKLKGEFINAVKAGDFDKAGKLYAFGEKNEPNIFKDALLRSTWLCDTIAEIKHKKDIKFLTNTLRFAIEYHLSREIFEVEAGRGKTLLEFAEKEGVKDKVIETVKNVGIDLSKYKQASNQLSKDQKIPTFLDKLNEHKGKVAIGVLLTGGAVTAFVLGQPIIGAIAAVAAFIAVSILIGEIYVGHKQQNAGSILRDMTLELFTDQQVRA